MKTTRIHRFRSFAILCLAGFVTQATADTLKLNKKGYFEKPGLEVTSFADYYPEGHQTGVTIIQHGVRVAANGDLRLEASPGQWSPVPKKVDETFDSDNQRISTSLAYPNEKLDRTGFNPVIYPDLKLTYQINVEALDGNAFKVSVDLDKPLPDEWVNKVGFNFELFPGHLFGKSYMIDGVSGHFPVQANGPIHDVHGAPLGLPMGEGHTLVVAPESALQRIKIESAEQPMQLLDGRANHNNSWFIVRSLIPAGKTKNALEWTITPSVEPDWRYKPVVQVSQVGYAAKQSKKIVVEQDKRDKQASALTLYKVTENGKQKVRTDKPDYWGEFLRYNYFTFDFSDIEEEGLYVAEYRGEQTHAFKISKDVYDRHVWQTTLEYYLPVQMCHMRVVENYRVWHDNCHEDDAKMSPVNHNHFDGYIAGPSTLTEYQPGEHVPGLNQGGWHDAGDYDLRVESQIGTVWRLAAMVEEFGIDYDATRIDQETSLVEIHRPDGVSDALQQIEHGLLSVMGGYESLGRLYRGIIVPSIDQYVMLGDAGSQTDGIVDDAPATLTENLFTSTNGADDRWVFTEDNPNRQLYTAAGLATAARVIKDYRPELAKKSLAAAEALYEVSVAEAESFGSKVFALSELAISSANRKAYLTQLVAMQEELVNNIDKVAWMIGRVMPLVENSGLDNTGFVNAIEQAVAAYQVKLRNEAEQTPYGVPYEPNIWGAGWAIQDFGVKQYFMHKAWPQHASTELFQNALNFILGVHPGENTMSFVSGVGSESALVAYGVNRGDWSFIPGGSVSGTALIRPDLPELKIWPFFWQQTEYVMGGGATNFMFLALAANSVTQQ
ncbi:MAG: glycoside hydrolase family 9 protein [Alteromonadaceae bacterium]|nr:glycoside hydrolase family 9 protein [Alteromonadaceae bacterium]